MFRNLEAEMKRNSINRETLAKTINKSYQTTMKKLNGQTPFTFDEVWKIRERLFPNLKLDYLFEMNNDPVESEA